MEALVTYVEEPGGTRKALDVPFRITVYKSDVYAQYPINYIQVSYVPQSIALFSY